MLDREPMIEFPWLALRFPWLDESMNGHLLVLYLVATFLAMIAPGPDMMFVLASGVRGGPRAGLMAALGVASSEVVHITAAAAGLSALFAAAPTVFTVLRLAGAAYLGYLGFQALRSAWRPDPLSVVPAGATGSISGHRAYLRGALTNLVNPKMVTFSVAFLPQFVDRSLGHVWLQFLVLGLIFLVFEMVVDGTVGLFAGRIGGVLARRRRARQAVDASSGTVMLALAGKLALERN
ncbi:LysE family translocator [Amycolatopsis sp. NPDC049253]|uniref:LysE family translocator n=1 Tax=Amycolatopsis sp. NPDC049253 TaxID=3155274 RepID=UPI00341EA7D9